MGFTLLRLVLTLVSGLPLLRRRAGNAGYGSRVAPRRTSAFL